MLKRAVAFLLVVISLFAFASCKDFGALIENEESAKEVIVFPKDNMFGLEKIAIFEDRAVAVFDEKTCDNFEYDENDLDDHGDYTLKRYLKKDDPGFKLYVKNLTYEATKSFRSTIKLKKGKYVVTVAFDNKESNKVDPRLPFEIWGFDIDEVFILIFEDSIELKYIARQPDVMWIYEHKYDRTKGTWNTVDEEKVGFDLSKI